VELKLEQLIKEWKQMKDAILVRLQNMCGTIGELHLKCYDEARDLILGEVEINIMDQIIPTDLKTKLREYGIRSIRLQSKCISLQPRIHETEIVINEKLIGSITYTKDGETKLSNGFKTSFLLSIATVIIVAYEKEIHEAFIKTIQDDVTSIIEMIKKLLGNRLDEMVDEAKLCKLGETS